ncbi:MAG TPA: class I SAM-dependent methyltransferase [Usitatibacter sp.]|jgi:SAM-dependent methyltransferase|nr:class I SAM-dependent methyltransferase [Usitatibacter sp.]
MGKLESLRAASLRDFEWVDAPGVAALRGVLQVDAPIVFQPVIELGATADDPAVASSEALQVAWLPRGTYRVQAPVPRLLAERGHLALRLRHRASMAMQTASHVEMPVPASIARAAPSPGAVAWQLEPVAPAPALETLSWRKGHEDWFFRHFDHAATTVVSYLLGDHPKLRGRILDVGCGDGITDLGIALRTGCEQLVGIDPFAGFERLPGIVAANNLPADIHDAANLRFMKEDANFLPFPDDSFDVVLSWGSIEHMAGGYLQALREMKRVLRPDGLLMMHPGLYYSNAGHHLGEFTSEPFFHLKKSREQIRDVVMSTPPRYMDRSGEFATNAQYFQWFTELNPITVTRIEQELRALDFRPWRVALRTEPVIEYTPEIEDYPIQDLATTELYSSWISRKKARPA